METSTQRTEGDLGCDRSSSAQSLGPGFFSHTFHGNLTYLFNLLLPVAHNPFINHSTGSYGMQAAHVSILFCIVSTKAQGLIDQKCFSPHFRVACDLPPEQVDACLQ